MMRQKRFSEHKRFLALRACWMILRGGSVAWKLNLTAEGDLEALGNGLFTADCLVRGKPLTAWHFEHGAPEAQGP